MLLATFAGVAVVTLIQAALPFADPSMLTGLVTLLVCGLAGLVVIFGLCALLRVPQMDMVTRLIRRLVRR